MAHLLALQFATPACSPVVVLSERAPQAPEGSGNL
jgi:hypothetical protein